MEDKIFRFSLIVSFLVHIFSLAVLLYTQIRYNREVSKNVEVVYYAQAQEDKTAQGPMEKPVKSVNEKKLKPPPEILSKDRADPASALNRLGKQPVKLEVHKKDPIKFHRSSEKRNVAIPLLKSDKITNPKYVNYLDRIRNKIKNRAYFYVDDPESQEGEVYLTFVISSDGSLKETKIIDEKSSASDYLRSIGLRSIKESNPYPPFPKDLNYPELPFSVMISIEITEE